MSYVDHIIESNDETGQQVSHEIRDANAQGRIATLEAGIDDVVDTANTAADNANAAKTAANNAATAANNAASSAASAAESAKRASEVAAQAIVDHSVPLMSSTMRGGAKLGSGLTVEDETLSVDTSALVTQAEKGAANGVAELDQNGLVLSSQLPSYVDDVVEGYYYEGDFYEESTHETLIVGETGKIYVDLSTDTSYRWSGSAYISISNPIDIATEAEALAGNDNTKMMTPLRVKQAMNANMDILDAVIGPNDLAEDGSLKAQIDALANSVGQLIVVETQSITTMGSDFAYFTPKNGYMAVFAEETTWNNYRVISISNPASALLFAENVPAGTRQFRIVFVKM